MTDEQYKVGVQKINGETTKTWNELAIEQNFSSGINYNNAVRQKMRIQGDKKSGSIDKNIQESILLQLNREITTKELAEKNNISERMVQASLEDLKELGYDVITENTTHKLNRLVIQKDENIIKNEWTGSKLIRFGLCGDNQENSKYTQITHLHNFYDRLLSEGITDVYHTGDIDEGEQMREGHQYECYAQGADDHVANIVKYYPKRQGIVSHFITGNHDHSIIKRAGYDIGKAIQKDRDDLKYLGQSFATIYLTPNCTLELRHPNDGTSYAISYKSQKMIDALSGGEKPNILAIGHYHKHENIFYRNIHCFQTGCFQAQTPWMRSKAIAAVLGGWIIEARVMDDGSLDSVKSKFFPYYTAIKDDYLNWR
jgi:biotin operon repressor